MSHLTLLSFTSSDRCRCLASLCPKAELLYSPVQLDLSTDATMSYYRFEPFINIRPSSLSEKGTPHTSEHTLASSNPTHDASNATFDTSDSSIDAQNEHNTVPHHRPNTAERHESLGVQTEWQAPKKWPSQPAPVHHQGLPSTSLVSPEESEITPQGAQTPNQLEDSRAGPNARTFDVAQSWRTGLNKWRVLSTCIFAVGNGMNDSGMCVS